MWKRAEPEAGRKEPSFEMPRQTPTEQPPAKRERATIGPGIFVRGEVKGEEDLLIQGHVEGTVELGEQSVTVGSQGRVQGDVSARVVDVHGRVEGELRGKERVIVRASARVTGNICAARIQLEDGCRYKGAIETSEAPPEPRASEPSKRSNPAPLHDRSEESARGPKAAISP